jgi:hypothetical protein
MPELTAVQELEQIAADTALENAAAGKTAKPAKAKTAGAYSGEEMDTIRNEAAIQGGMLTNEDVKALLKNPVFKDKTLPSLRGKVSAMKLYKKLDPSAPKPAGTESAPTRKLDFVRTIENMLNVPIDTFATFEKASKVQLVKMVKSLISLSDQLETQ